MFSAVFGELCDNSVMRDLPENLFANPVWSALHSQHRHFAVINGNASRYPADVVPFASISESNPASMQQLHELLTPGDSVWFIAERYSEIPQLHRHETLDCLQMVLPENVSPPESPIAVVPLFCAHAQEMVALTTVAFPGFFRQRTCEMGAYFGIRSFSGELIAMGGERLKLDGFSEISAVCTHPSFRGQGFAARLMWEVVRVQRREGVTSFLHVSATNHNAIKLYLHMGFQVARKVILHRTSRND